MVLTKKGKRKVQDKLLTVKATAEFLADLEEAARASNDGSVSEFVRHAVINRAKRYGVKIRR